MAFIICATSEPWKQSCLSFGKAQTSRGGVCLAFFLHSTWTSAIWLLNHVLKAVQNSLAVFVNNNDQFTEALQETSLCFFIIIIYLYIYTPCHKYTVFWLGFATASEGIFLPPSKKVCRSGGNFYFNIFILWINILWNKISVTCQFWVIKFYIFMLNRKILTTPLSLEKQTEWTWHEASLAETQVQLSMSDYLPQVLQLLDKHFSHFFCSGIVLLLCSPLLCFHFSSKNMSFPWCIERKE